MDFVGHGGLDMGLYLIVEWIVCKDTVSLWFSRSLFLPKSFQDSDHVQDALWPACNELSNIIMLCESGYHRNLFTPGRTASAGPTKANGKCCPTETSTPSNAA